MTNLFYDEEIEVIALLNQGNKPAEIVDDRLDRNILASACTKVLNDPRGFLIRLPDATIRVNMVHDGIVKYTRTENRSRNVTIGSLSMLQFHVMLAEEKAFDEWPEERVYTYTDGDSWQYQFKGVAYKGFETSVLAREELDQKIAEEDARSG